MDRDPAAATGALHVAREYVAALGGDDPEAVATLVSSDFVNEHHAELGSGCVGRDEYARRLPGFFRTFAERHYEVTETTVGVHVAPPSRTGNGVGAGDGAIAGADVQTAVDDGPASEVVVRYRFRALVDGTRIDIPGVMWISVHDGLVTRRLDCWDSLTFHRQTGTTPS